MARPIEFDRNEVLQNAMNTFWQQGFRETSMQDLVRATSLHPGSLYSAFGNKRRLFIEALHLYFESRHRKMQSLLAGADTPLAGVRRYFAALLDAILSDSDSSGCLLINSAMEFSTSDAEIAGIIDGMFASNEKLLCETLERAQANGELAAERNPAELARYLLVGVRGLRVYARSRPSREELESCVEQLLLPLAS
jgi:TetR/AcrR family transcriptional repressor of nem operon